MPELSSPSPEIDWQRLNGSIVLVKSRRDHRNPQAAIRGTLVVTDNAGATPPEVRIEFDVPQMFKKTAHHRSLHLDYSGLTQLLDSEENGVFEYTTDEALD